MWYNFLKMGGGNMKKPVKILIWIVAIIIVFFVIANIAISVFAKDIVVKQLEANLKMPCSLGKISLSFPLTINLIDLKTGELAKVDRLSVSPNILGFIAGKIVLSDLTLINPIINLEQASDGTLSLPKFEQKGKPPEIYITGLHIRSGKFIFTDKKVRPDGFKVLLGRLNVDVYKIMFPVTSLDVKFRVSADFLSPEEKRIGSVLLSGWVDFGPKDMDGSLEVKDLDMTYFSPYYGNFISNKKLLQAMLNVNSVFKAEKNNLEIDTNFRLSNLVYAKAEAQEGLTPELSLTRNALDFFTDEKGNLSLEFKINTKLDNPNITNEQLQKIILKAAAKNLSNQSPESLIKKVGSNIDEFKAFGKSMEKMFKGK